MLSRIYERAGDLTEEHGLRGFDALHLATFVTARRQIEGLELLTADEHLREAATAV